MIGMRERVLALGGSMTVVSTGQGVTVEALVPNRSQQPQVAGFP
jgi:two-component system sensor histidine kinase UhpB